MVEFDGRRSGTFHYGRLKYHECRRGKSNTRHPLPGGSTMRHPLSCLLTISLAFLSPFGAPAGFSSGGNQKPVVKAKPSGIDSFGDPFPDGAFYRLGTVRLRPQ